MKKLILLTIFATTMLFGCEEYDYMTVHAYRYVPEWNFVDDSVLPFILITSAWACKNTEYYFEEYQYSDSAIFRLYNYDCSFCLVFNKITRECDIQFSSHDESYNYNIFKKMIDFFLSQN